MAFKPLPVNVSTTDSDEEMRPESIKDFAADATTADVGSTLKTGTANDLPPFDCCALALEWGATFVARSFSGDKKQLQAILKAAIAHNGLTVIDVISPCVTFNDHTGSTKSYSYMKDHEEVLHDLDFVPHFEDIDVEIAEGETREVEMHDGSRLRIKKLEREYDPTNKMSALAMLGEAQEKGEVLTGVLYVNTQKPNFLQLLNMTDERLATLPESITRPPRSVLDQVMEELRLVMSDTLKSVCKMYVALDSRQC